MSKEEQEPREIDNYRQGKLVKLLFERGCIDLTEQRGTSGKTIQYRLALDHTKGDPEVFRATAEEYIRFISDIRHAGRLQFDLVADVPSAVSHIAAIVAYRLRVPMVTPRKDSDEIDGLRPEFRGKSALLVDDAVTTGGSILKAAHKLRFVGLQVNQALILLDRQENDAKARLADHGIEFFAPFCATDFFEEAIRQKLIDQQEFDRLTRNVKPY